MIYTPGIWNWSIVCVAVGIEVYDIIDVLGFVVSAICMRVLS